MVINAANVTARRSWPAERPRPARGLHGRLGRERDRDPGLCHGRVFGGPGGHRAVGLALQRHHVSLDDLVVDDEVRSVTPCFLGAEPATAPGLGGGTLRPLERVEDLARELVRSLSPEPRDVAVLLDRPPSDIIGGDRPRVADGDQVLLLPDIWSGRVTEPRLRDRVEAMTTAAEAATGYGPRSTVGWL
ncbi:DUF3500 domain-containing protein [Geodermatophilus sp. SYSU D01105]